MPILGKTSLIGGLQEDLYTLPITDITKSMLNKGVFASDDCMNARLPVGSGLLMDKKKVNSKDDSYGKRQAWWIEEKCIPRQPTVSKKYGNETFKIPFSSSYCIKEPFTNKDEDYENIDLSSHLFILSMILIFITVMRK